MRVHNNIYANIRLSAILLGVLIFLWIFSSLQSTVLLFDKNKKEFVIKRISGWSWKAVYGKYLWREFIVLLILTIWFAIANLIKEVGIYYYICTDLMIALIEIIVFHSCIKYSEKKKVVETLKGE